MKKIYILFLIALLTAYFSACSTTTTKKKADSSANVAENKQESANNEETKSGESNVKTDSETNSEVSKTSNAALSPSEILKAYDEASNAKNPEKVKSLISKGSVELIQKRAKEEGVSLDKLIREGNGIPPIEAEETRNEKISGDKATIEIRFTDMENFDTVPFIKEDGSWKIDFVKFLDDMKKKINNG